jgi:hypothetical protein
MVRFVFPRCRSYGAWKSLSSGFYKDVAHTALQRSPSCVVPLRLRNHLSTGRNDSLRSQNETQEAPTPSQHGRVYQLPSRSKPMTYVASFSGAHQPPLRTLSQKKLKRLPSAGGLGELSPNRKGSCRPACHWCSNEPVHGAWSRVRRPYHWWRA